MQFMMLDDMVEVRSHSRLYLTPLRCPRSTGSMISTQHVASNFSVLSRAVLLGGVAVITNEVLRK